MSYNSTINTSGIFYVYDGSFDGLLTVIYTAVYSRITPLGISTERGLQLSFETRYIEIETNKTRAKQVYDAIYKKIGSFGMKRLYYVFLSSDSDKELVIYNYMLLGFKNGELTNSSLANETVSRAFQLAQNVSRETEKFRQFTRFSVMERGVQYAKIAPKNNLLPILTPFFVSRLKVIPFVLHDVTHNLCAVYNEGEWYVTSAEGCCPPAPSDEEVKVRGQWRAFFDAISIKERANSKLQKQNMPSRYFKSVWSVQ